MNTFVHRSDDPAPSVESASLHGVAMPPGNPYQPMNHVTADGVQGGIIYHPQDPWMTAAMNNILDFTTLGLEHWESGLGEFILSADHVDNNQLGIGFPSFV